MLARLTTVLLVSCLGLPALAEEPLFDLEKEKVLYAVGYAHLDTQWRWDFTTTIDEYLKATLDENFQRFETYPGYVFNFTGSVRYGMIKEYYPERYERMKKYIAEGRWFVSGSSVDEGDVNVPSAEAVLRQVLYGNESFRREFGKESVDFMLPDCFGFPASMPSIWAHAGLRGFSTQKLTWGSAVGIPFGVGFWEGPDGEGVIAALDPGAYVGAIEGRVDLNESWAERIEENGREFGVWADYHYYGVGDMGGAPREKDVANYLASVDRDDSLFRVALTSSDQMFRDMSDEMAARLPRYRGDMLLTEHSAGTLTSQSYMKRWNRKGELLADSAERLAVAADWLGGRRYPLEKLNAGWERLLANQMHDILPGTSIPRAYEWSWNDEIVAQNLFAEVLTDSARSLASELDTDTFGIPIVVWNPLTIARQDVVEVEVELPRRIHRSLSVFDANEQPVPTQVLERSGQGARVIFLAEAAPNSLAVYELRQGFAAERSKTAPKAKGRSLSNEHYAVRIDENGDVASIIDKSAGNRELLREPMRLVFTPEKPRSFPAWNMDWADRNREPIGFVEGPAEVRVVENGPVRAAIEVRRRAFNSTFVQRIRLSAGDAGRRVEFDTDIDWQGTGGALRATVPLQIANPVATYNWGLGTIERGNNEPKKYEVPSHEWFDLTDARRLHGEYGVSVLEDSKFGSDKPDDQTLRLTLLYSPEVRKSYMDQHSQDWGRHEMLYALYGHEGDWRAGLSEWQGRRLNQPLVGFQAERHPGKLGREFSWLSVSTPQVDARALKRAERGEHVILRLQELWGQPATGVEVAVGNGIVEAWAVDGQERRIGDVAVTDGKLVVDLGKFSPRSFALRLAAGPVGLSAPESKPIALPFDLDVVTTDAERDAGAMDAEGRSYPAEMLSSRIVSEGVAFELGDANTPNAVSCRGQVIDLPEGSWTRIDLLAAATEDTGPARFRVGERPQLRAVQSWTGFVGQFDDRLWDREMPEVDFGGEGQVVGFEAGYIKRDPIAWFATHRHHPAAGNESYRFSYLFRYSLDVPKGATTLTLPQDPRIRVLAASAVRGGGSRVQAAAPLYDDFSDRGPLEFRHVYPPPPKPVFDGLAPIGSFTTDKAKSFEALAMGAPVDDDAATGLAFRYHEGGGEWPPHWGSAPVDGTFPRLSDGAVAQNDDDTSACVWYDNEGRFSLDLGESTELARVNSYSWHVNERAPQWFSLWGSNAEAMPEADFAQGTHEGWTLLAVVDSRDLGTGGIQGSSVTGPNGAPLGPWRHLLWITQDVGNGTFFTEIDVHATR